jgi:GntR family transcriptional regulator, transcriptional repressor for pyruvate dehydrogenase complex
MSSTTAKIELEAIPRSRVYKAVAQQLEERILAYLKPGDMFPSERELVQVLGVSRSSVREAIHSLELMGLVEVRQGVGAVVRDPAADSHVGPIADALLQKQEHIAELLDVRKLLEPPVARIAAHHITPEQILEMEKLLQRQEEKLSRNEPGVEEDSSFHYTIAAAADNSVVLRLVDVLMDLLRETREKALQIDGRAERSLAGHRRILAALKARDAAGAGEAMLQHVSEIEDIVLNKLQKGWRLPNGPTICR